MRLPLTSEERQVLEAALMAYMPKMGTGNGCEAEQRRKRHIARDLADRVRVAPLA